MAGRGTEKLIDDAEELMVNLNLVLDQVVDAGVIVKPNPILNKTEKGNPSFHVRFNFVIAKKD